MLLFIAYAQYKKSVGRLGITWRRDEQKAFRDGECHVQK